MISRTLPSHRARSRAGAIIWIDTAAALALPGVLCVLTHENAPRLNPVDEQLQFPIDELLVLQDPSVAFHGQFIAAAVAETAEFAQHAANLVEVRYEQQPHDVVMPTDGNGLDTPVGAVPQVGVRRERHDRRRRRSRRCATLRCRGSTRPIRPDGSTTIPSSRTPRSRWHSPTGSRSTTPRRRRCGFESASRRLSACPRRRSTSSATTSVAGSAARSSTSECSSPFLASRQLQRPVKLALTRRQMYSVAGYGSPTSQRIRLGADRDGRLPGDRPRCDRADVTAPRARGSGGIGDAHHVRLSYAQYQPQDRTPRPASPVDDARARDPRRACLPSSRRSTRWPTPAAWTRSTSGSPNEPEVDPETGHPFSSRNVVACLTEGAERFGWAPRGSRREGNATEVVRTGMGVAASIFHALQCPCDASSASSPTVRSWSRWPRSTSGPARARC